MAQNVASKTVTQNPSTFVIGISFVYEQSCARGQNLSSGKQSPVHAEETRNCPIVNQDAAVPSDQAPAACAFACKRYPHVATSRLSDRAAKMTTTEQTIRLHVNGNSHEVEAAPDTPLLYILRNDLELNGPKYGCGLGECGACVVTIDGVAARSCVIPVSGCFERDIVTLEGLGSREHPDPVQTAFIEEQAAQCGYCLNGMIMTTKALLMRNPRPTRVEAMEALRYNLCRCGAHIEILRAVMRASGQTLPLGAD
jgi:nicotinate dehydrogenase subunit A